MPSARPTRGPPGSAAPDTIIEAKGYEGLLALGARGMSVCRLLHEKTSDERKWRPLDQFLFDKAHDPRSLRLPTWGKRFEAPTERPLARLRAGRPA